MADDQIPFNRASLVGRELQYIAQSIAQGHISGGGPFTGKCQALLEEQLGVRKALLTTSCTHSLEMAALLLECGPGDEVVFPAFTFVSTVNAFVLRGVQPVFVDIRPDTLNMDETRLERVLSRRTKAIVVVHYAGVGCEMREIMEIARRFGVDVVEDNAHGLFGKYRDRRLGTFGCLATQSFHETKNITCGEGGALLINEDRFIERAEIIREKGTDRSRFFRGEIDKYTWVDIGSSYLPSDILAAILYAQLENWREIQSRRRCIYDSYDTRLADWAKDQGVRLPFVPAHCEHSSHLFYLLMPSLRARTELIRHLQRRGIYAVFHYVPLHLSKMGRMFGGKEGDCPVTESVADRLLRLPFYRGMTEDDVSRVVEATREFSVSRAGDPGIDP